MRRLFLAALALLALPRAQAADDPLTPWFERAMRTSRSLAASRGCSPDGSFLPADYLDRRGFVEAPEMPGASPTFAGDVHFEPEGAASEKDVFEARTFAALPRRALIGAHGEGRSEVWDYPAGTCVAHEIRLRTSPPRLFELRLLVKQRDGRWSYRVFASRPSGELAEYLEDGPQLSLPLALASGKSVTMTLSRFAPSESLNCRTCHRAVNRGRGPQPDIERVGPCGFTPANEGIRSIWAARFKQRYGYDPFQARPD